MTYNATLQCPHCGKTHLLVMNERMETGVMYCEKENDPMCCQKQFAYSVQLQTVAMVSTFKLIDQKSYQS